MSIARLFGEFISKYDISEREDTYRVYRDLVDEDKVGGREEVVKDANGDTLVHNGRGLRVSTRTDDGGRDIRPGNGDP